MKKLKMLIIMIMFTSAYAEKDIVKWLENSPVNKSVYAHVRLKERKHRYHKTLIAGRGIKREKKIGCTVLR